MLSRFQKLSHRYLVNGLFLAAFWIKCELELCAYFLDFKTTEASFARSGFQILQIAIYNKALRLECLEGSLELSNPNEDNLSI